MHLGACDVALHTTLLSLRHAASRIDSGAGRRPAGPVLAGRVRAQAARCAEEVLATVGHALGPGPLALDPEHAARVADLMLYVRQHHAERDLAALGRLVAPDADQRPRRGAVTRDPGAVPPRRPRHPGEHLARLATAGTTSRCWTCRRWRGDYDRVLVVSAHPDDETLGVGGLVADLADRGVALDVLVATDGERSHPVGGSRARHCPGCPTGAPRWSARWLGSVPGDRDPHRRPGRRARSSHADTVVDAVRARSDPATLVLAPWIADGHADHDALGRACVDGGVAQRRRPRVLPDLALALGVTGGPALA